MLGFSQIVLCYRGKGLNHDLCPNLSCINLTITSEVGSTTSMEKTFELECILFQQ